MQLDVTPSLGIADTSSFVKTLVKALEISSPLLCGSLWVTSLSCKGTTSQWSFHYRLIRKRT